jgi:hypothetical protein
MDSEGTICDDRGLSVQNTVPLFTPTQKSHV